MSLILLYFLHNTSVLSFHIDADLTLSIWQYVYVFDVGMFYRTIMHPCGYLRMCNCWGLKGMQVSNPSNSPLKYQQFREKEITDFRGSLFVIFLLTYTSRVWQLKYKNNLQESDLSKAPKVFIIWRNIHDNGWNNSEMYLMITMHTVWFQYWFS